MLSLKQRMLFVVLFLSFSISAFGQREPFEERSALIPSLPAAKAYLRNKLGLAQFQKEDYLEALKTFGQILSLNPQGGRAHFNMAITFEALGQKDKALASYALALDYAGKDPELLFAVNYNLGVIAGKEKKVDEALAYYQLALQYYPQSFETKINIELLMNQQQQDQQNQKSKDQKDQDQKDQENKDQDKNKQDQQDQQKDQDKGKEDQQDQQKDQDQKDKEEKEKEEKEGDQQKDENKEQEKKNKGEYEKPQPQEFKSQELAPSDVNKILEEIRQQEQKIRSDFQRKETKEKPREKSW